MKKNSCLKNLWIMRHGLAENQFESDFSRELSTVGANQVESVAQQLFESEALLPTQMLVSPFVRTQQTAKIMHQKLAMIEPFETDKLLVHFGDAKLLGDFLLASNFEHLIIVSHMPIVAELCQYLLPSCNIYGFQTAQIVKLTFESETIAKLSNVYLPKTI